MPKQIIPRQIKSRILGDLEKSLQDNIHPNFSPIQTSQKLAEIFDKEFRRRRRGSDGRRYHIDTVFVGNYAIDQENPEQTILIGTPAGSDPYGCSPIPLDPKVSIIARAAITGNDQHVPDISKDPSHWECSGDAQHEEVYTILSAEPYSSGPFKGYDALVGVLDIDFGKKHVLTRNESKKLGDIVRPYGALVFPGEPRFELEMKHLVHRRPTQRVYNQKGKELREAS